MRTSLVITIAASCTVLAAVIVITLVVTLSPNTGGPVDYLSLIIDGIHTDSIDKFLRNLTSSPHPAGSDRDAEIAKYLQEVWTQQGLMGVKQEAYQVLLASANLGTINQVMVVESNDSISWEASGTQPPPYDSGQPYPTYIAFSAIKTAQSQRVVYVNYAREEDYQQLGRMGLSLAGTIVLARYGLVATDFKVRGAQARGATGVLLYADPADVAPGADSNATYPDGIYPDGIWAPPRAVRLDSIRHQGDLSTPGFPATDWAYRIPDIELDLPSIPVQPLSYRDAEHILSLLKGEPAPEEWQGDLDLTYNLGPDVQRGAKVKMQVNNIHETKTVHNVMAMLPGEEEPERYVVVGNHYDAWLYGGVNPSSSTAAMLELTRVLANLYHDGWRPRRTLVFCAWAAGEQGVIGSTEFTEMLTEVLKDRAVVYLNMDNVMSGTFSFGARGVPHIRDAVFAVTNLIPNPDPEEASLGHNLYDTWVSRYPDESEKTPVVGSLGNDGDFRAFLYNLGVASLDLKFVEAPDEPFLPLYHTACDTYELATSSWTQTFATTRLLPVLAYQFASHPILPLNIPTFGDFLVAEMDAFMVDHGTLFSQLGVDIDVLQEAVSALSTATLTFANNLNKIDVNDRLVARRYNDAMMLMDRCLLSPKGLSDRTLINHVIMAPSWKNDLVWEVFPSLRDLMEAQDLDDTELKQKLEEQVGVVTHHLKMATSALTFTPW